MRKSTILAAIAFATSATSVLAQEYLHINDAYGNQVYTLPMEEIDHISLEGAILLPDLLKEDESVTLFCAALEATGLDKALAIDFDYTYNARNYPNFTYRANIWTEIAVVPPSKMTGYTMFVETDKVLKEKYGVTDLNGLKALAKNIYDKTYPEDAGLYDGDVTHPKNPLYRFVAYHILTRDVQELNRLTGRILTYKNINEPMGIHVDRMNPIEWYQTLLPNTMIKCEMLTMANWMGADCTLRNYYLNRRWDDLFSLRGSEVAQPVEENAAINGRYFYADDVVAFTEDVRDKVQNMLIRMDFSTVFPELMTQDIRQNGNPTVDDNSSIADETFKNGRNYWLPDGYLEGLKVHNGTMVYRRPRINFWSYQGDEFNVFGDYDIEISLPPVPFSGEWQVRLGFCALGTRGIAQIYFDGVAQGEPIDMRIYLNDPSIMGTEFQVDDNGRYYASLTYEEKVADQKLLKSKGYYRGPLGGYHTNGDTRYEWVGKDRTYRRVLCQTYIDHTKGHTLRVQCASKSVVGNNNEFMLDYIELVPKSVYDVPEGVLECDL